MKFLRGYQFKISTSHGIRIHYLDLVVTSISLEFGNEDILKFNQLKKFLGTLRLLGPVETVDAGSQMLNRVMTEILLEPTSDQKTEGSVSISYHPIFIHCEDS